MEINIGVVYELSYSEMVYLGISITIIIKGHIHHL